MKSPNMISTTGFMPVIAAPTAMPVKPASEIGVSMTRSVPNSFTSPVRTLKGCPASAMSSPQMKTFGSRRISSARASRTASARVISRVAVAVSGINVLIHLVGSRVRSIDGELHGAVHFRLNFGLNLAYGRRIHDTSLRQKFLHVDNGITIGLPGQFFLFRAV